MINASGKRDANCDRRRFEQIQRTACARIRNLSVSARNAQPRASPALMGLCGTYKRNISRKRRLGPALVRRALVT